MKTFLRSKPSRIVIVGLGAKGCAVGTQECGTQTCIEFSPAVEMETPVIDTNGAGDGLAVGFLSSKVLDNYSLRDSILRGQITARYTCTQKASSSNLITPEQLEHYFQAQVS
jgi:sugar/nucleoside kinase (ribokinase family)